MLVYNETLKIAFHEIPCRWRDVATSERWKRQKLPSGQTGACTGSRPLSMDWSQCAVSIFSTRSDNRDAVCETFSSRDNASCCRHMTRVLSSEGHAYYKIYRMIVRAHQSNTKRVCWKLRAMVSNWSVVLFINSQELFQPIPHQSIKKVENGLDWVWSWLHTTYEIVSSWWCHFMPLNLWISHVSREPTC